MSAVFKQEAYKLMDALLETANGDELAEKARQTCMGLPRDVHAFLKRAFPAAERDEATFVLGQARIEDGTAPSPR
jgi:hypothetical protein